MTNKTMELDEKLEHDTINLQNYDHDKIYHRNRIILL